MTTKLSATHKTGMEMLDHEHQSMISVLSGISYYLSINNRGRGKIKNQVDVFSKMAKAHFHDEEEYLESIDHLDKESRRKERQKHEKELDGILGEYDDPVDLVDKLEKWLMAHMLEWNAKMLRAEL